MTDLPMTGDRVRAEGRPELLVVAVDPDSRTVAVTDPAALRVMWLRADDLELVAACTYTGAFPDRDGYGGALIAVDFDGPLHTYSSGWTGYDPTDPPSPGALDAIGTLLGGGARVVVHSARADSRAGQRGIERFLDRHGFPDLPVTNIKPPAAAYIDDRAVPWHAADGWTDRVFRAARGLCALRYRGEATPPEVVK